MELADESDVDHLKHVMYETNQKVHLYLSVGDEEVEEQPPVVKSQFIGVKSIRGIGDRKSGGNQSRGRGNDIGVGYEKKASVADKFVSDNDNIVSDDDNEPNLRMTELEYQNLFKFGEVTDFDDQLCDEKSNEDWSEDEYTQRKIAFNPWYFIPPIPDYLEPILEPGPFHS